MQLGKARNLINIRLTAVAALNVFLGVFIAALILESLLRVNPTLLLRGMSAPAPIDNAITEWVYEIHRSDADVFLWQPQLIESIPVSEDMLESIVHYQTDQFGFPNQSPAPPEYDIVILGRSFSMGAQSGNPWPERIAEMTGLHVLNLSQTGNDIDTKLEFFTRFGIPSDPQIVIVEVLPAMDIIGFESQPPLLIQRLPPPIIRLLTNNGWGRSDQGEVKPIYPIEAQVFGMPFQLTFFVNYVSALSVSPEILSVSNSWRLYQDALTMLNDVADREGVCVIFLHASTKASTYIPLVDDPNVLNNIHIGWDAWKIDQDRNFYQDPTARVSIESMQRNANEIRGFLQEFSQRNNFRWIDPTDAMIERIRMGQDPFMAYDTHWSDLGHEIVAQLISAYLQDNNCE